MIQNVMKIFISLIIYSFTLLHAQDFREFKTGFKTIFINPNEANSYYFGFNPAMMNFNPEDELLTFSSDINHEDGKFKQFFDPVSNSLYQLTASGKKSIDSSQRFKGSFGFFRVTRNNWNWIFTRDYSTSNPFLIGDSTSGDSRINGIKMNAEYSNKLFEDFSFGLSLNYSVDEMLKEISPRPTSVHRDIHSRVGLNYSISKELNFGIVADISDRNEEISYREDEGSITQETIILKFKGYDFPNVYRKKTETRYSYINSYAGGMTISYQSPTMLSAVGYLLSGFDKTNIKDDAIDPTTEGFWMNDFLNAGLQVSLLLDERFETGLIYNFHKDDGWAKYPKYNVLYSSKKFDHHSLNIGLKYASNSGFSVGIEGGVVFNSNDEHDFYSNISNDYKSNIYFGKAGLGFVLNDEVSSIISYGFYQNSIPEFSLKLNDQSNYFYQYKKYDFIFFQTEYYKHELSLATKLSAWFGGYFYIYLNYASMVPINTNEFRSEIRSQFSSSIEYRVKVF